MADVELVIKISEDLYKDTKANINFIDLGKTLILRRAVANGTPLPKSELITKGQAVELVEFYQLNPQHFTFNNLIEDIRNEKPIIEADKEK